MLKWREGLGLLAVTTGGMLCGAAAITDYREPIGWWMLALFFVLSGIWLVLFADLDIEED